MLDLVFATALQDVIWRKRQLFTANGIAVLFALTVTFGPNYSTLVAWRVYQGFKPLSHEPAGVVVNWERHSRRNGVGYLLPVPACPVASTSK